MVARAGVRVCVCVLCWSVLVCVAFWEGRTYTTLGTLEGTSLVYVIFFPRATKKGKPSPAE